MITEFLLFLFLTGRKRNKYFHFDFGKFSKWLTDKEKMGKFTEILEKWKNLFPSNN